MPRPRAKRPTAKQSRQALEKIAEVFRLLAEPTRLAIIQELKAGPMTVGALVESLATSQANVSKQLKTLYDGGVLAREKDGASVRYQLDDEMIMPLCELVCERLNKQARKAAPSYSI